MIRKLQIKNSYTLERACPARHVSKWNSEMFMDTRNSKHIHLKLEQLDAHLAFPLTRAFWSQGERIEFNQKIQLWLKNFRLCIHVLSTAKVIQNKSLNQNMESLKSFNYIKCFQIRHYTVFGMFNFFLNFHQHLWYIVIIPTPYTITNILHNISSFPERKSRRFVNHIPYSLVWQMVSEKNNHHEIQLLLKKKKKPSSLWLIMNKVV